MIFVKKQDYERASFWRDIERELNKIKLGNHKLIDFINKYKYERYSNIRVIVPYEDVYELIKPLDVIYQRKEKIEKLRSKL